jgi:adenylate kinase
MVGERTNALAITADVAPVLSRLESDRKLDRKAEAEAEMARFQELARMKSAQRETRARELVTSALQRNESLDLEPGFSPSRQVVHP